MKNEAFRHRRNRKRRPSRPKSTMGRNPEECGVIPRPPSARKPLTSTTWFAPILRNAHLRVRTLVDVNALDKTHLAVLQLHNQRCRAYPVAEETHALQ